MADYMNKIRYKLVIKADYVNSLDGVNASYPLELTFEGSMTEGTGKDQADWVWFDYRTLNASADDNLDLHGGITNAFGSALSGTKLKMIFIKNTNTTAGDIISVGGDAAPIRIGLFGADNDEIKIYPGGILFWWNPSAAGATITHGADDYLEVTEVGTANANTYHIMLAGSDT